MKVGSFIVTSSVHTERERFVLLWPALGIRKARLSRVLGFGLGLGWLHWRVEWRVFAMRRSA